MTKRTTKQPTIFALASGRGRAGVAVMRLSGPKAGEALKSLTGKTLPKPREAAFCRFKAPGTGDLVDSGLALWFPGPESFTGEDVVELHLHGSPAVLEKVSNILAEEGLRTAEPGEFTKRAFENGKMDLTQAEGLNDLVLAETEAQRKQALYQLGGGLSDIYAAWRGKLLDCLADIEATIDFSDEEIPEGLLAKVRKGVEALKTGIEKTLKDFKRGQAIRRGYKIVLLGETNVGKSSLLNALAREEKAIVSDIAGTTRDAIEVHMDLAGYSVILVDTAGLREARDEIEREGIRRTQVHAGEAQLKLLLTEANDWPKIPESLKKHLGPEAIVLLTKADLVKSETPKSKEKSGFQEILISSKTGEGLDELIQNLERRVVKDLEAADPPGLTKARHREALKETLEALDRFLAHDLQAADPAILAEDLRLAARALKSLTGEVGVEEILGQIFSRFCIGK